MKKIIRLTESDLTRIVRRVIQEQSNEVNIPLVWELAKNLGMFYSLPMGPEQIFFHYGKNNAAKSIQKIWMDTVNQKPMTITIQDERGVKEFPASTPVNKIVEYAKGSKSYKKLSSSPLTDTKLTESDLARIAKRVIRENQMNEDINITDEDFPFPDDPNQLNKWHVEEIFKVASSADEANEMIKDHYPGYYFEQTFETPNGKTMNFMSPEGEEIAGRYIIGCCGGSGGAEQMDRFKRSDDAFYNPRKRY